MMPGRKLSPKDVQDRNIVANNLNNLINQKHLKQIDIVRETGIPASTITGYVKARSLPSPENVEKLADFFHVDKSEIDPRYSKASATNNTKELDIDNTLYYNGKEIPDKYKKIIKELMDMDDD